MNLLGLVFSLLMILSYGFYASWGKWVFSSQLCTTYVKHEKVMRRLLNHYQSEVYEGLDRKRNPPESHPERKKISQPSEPSSEQESKTPRPNGACARLNLWPLIQEGREAHPTLYEVAANMIRLFYGSLQSQTKRFEYHFLNALLAAAKTAAQQPAPFALEKIDLGDAELQRIYYKMLKGTKQWDLDANLGYPSLLDYVKAEPVIEKICLFHAHPDLIAVLFNHKIARPFYEAIHCQKAPPATQELVEKFCSEHHQTAIDRELFNLVQFGRAFHSEQKKMFVAQEGDLLLRKEFLMKVKR